MAVQIAGLRLRNPLICGSGEHVMTPEGIDAALDAGVAAVVAKSANESAAARAQLRSAEYLLLDADWRPLPDGAAPAGASLLNRSGLVDMPFAEWVEVLAAADSRAAARGAYVVASLIPGAPDELPRLAAQVEAAGVRWLELNLSAPHAGEAPPGAIGRLSGAAAVRHATEAVRGAVSIPLTVKLTAESDDLVALAAAARDAGADAVALTGRHLAFLPDPATRRPVLGTFGAIGGGWALPLTLRWVAKTRLELGPDLPLIGSNGARSGLDVARFLLAGASAVQTATVPWTAGPAGLRRLLAELEEYLAAAGADAAAIVGEAADAAMTYTEAATGRRA